MKETILNSEKFTVYVKKAAAFIPGLRFSVEVTQTMELPKPWNKWTKVRFNNDGQLSVAKIQK